MKSGAILVSELVTKRQELFDTMEDRYNIIRNGEILHSNLTEEEYFNAIEDLADEFYQSGSLNPNEIETEILTNTMEKTNV